MLYDTRWDQNTEIKVNPLSLSSLIAWLETMPPAKTYNYTSCNDCLAAQYHEVIGHDYKVPVIVFPRRSNSFPVQLERIAARAPHTFGAALTRARAIMEQGA